MAKKDVISEAYRKSSISPKSMFKNSMKHLEKLLSKSDKKRTPGMPSEKEMEEHDRNQTERENYRVHEHNKLHKKKKK